MRRSWSWHWQNQHRIVKVEQANCRFIILLTKRSTPQLFFVHQSSSSWASVSISRCELLSFKVCIFVQVQHSHEKSFLTFNEPLLIPNVRYYPLTCRILERTWEGSDSSSTLSSPSNSSNVHCLVQLLGELDSTSDHDQLIFLCCDYYRLALTLDFGRRSQYLFSSKRDSACAAPVSSRMNVCKRAGQFWLYRSLRKMVVNCIIWGIIVAFIVVIIVIAHRSANRQAVPACCMQLHAMQGDEGDCAQSSHVFLLGES